MTLNFIYFNFFYLYLCWIIKNQIVMQTNKSNGEIIVRAKKRKSWAERLEEYKAKGFQTDEFGVTINGTRYYRMA